MRFADRKLEREYSAYLAGRQADSDVWWSIASTLLGCLLLVKIRHIMHSSTFWTAFVHLCINNTVNIAIILMARGGNRDRYNYARAREPLLLVSKLFRGYSLKRLPTPYEYAVSAEGAAPLYSSVSAAISPLVRHSIQLLIYANDFRLVSSKQRFIMLWITVAPLFRRFELTCSAFACHNPATLAMFSHVATILKGHLHVFLPVVVWSKLEQVNPCLSVCLWSLLIIGYFLPLSIGNVWEERSRLEFLLANRIGALSPPVLPVALVNAIVVTTLAGSIVALALDTVTTFVGIL